MSCTVSHELSRVMLSELLLSEKDATRVWLRAEMDRLVDPMLDSIFDRLTTKLTNGLERTQSGDDWGQVGNRKHGQVHQPSSSHLIQQHLPNDPIHCNENINQQSEVRPLVQPLICTYDQINFEHLSNEPADQALFPPALSPTIVNVQSNYNSNDPNLNGQDEDECYCDECLGVIEIDDEEVDDDDDDDSVQLIEDVEELARPLKKPRMESTQPHNSTQAEVANQSPRQPTDEAQPNQVRNKQIITVHLQCAHCPNTFPEDQLPQHMFDEHSIGPNRCLLKDCAQSFHNRAILRKHIKHVHRHTTQWHCDKCSKHFISYQILSIHNINQHQLGLFLCSHPSCTFTGECKGKVYGHYTTQHRQTLNCQHSACQYQTSSLADMKKHERAHSGIKPYRCKWPNCGYATTRKEHAINHIRRKHFAHKSSFAPNGAQLGDPKDFLEVVHELLV